MAARTFIQRSRAKGAAEKAAYHQVVGAGKSRIRRPFFALTARDEAVLVALVEQQLDRAERQP
jgi:hypothetical protein